MKTTLILAGAITLVLISMESPAFSSPAPTNEAIASLMSDTPSDEGLVRQKRGTGGYGDRCNSNGDCKRDFVCVGGYSILGHFVTQCAYPRGYGKKCNSDGDCRRGLRCVGANSKYAEYARCYY